MRGQKGGNHWVRTFSGENKRGTGLCFGGIKGEREEIGMNCFEKMKKGTKTFREKIRTEAVSFGRSKGGKKAERINLRKIKG